MMIPKLRDALRNAVLHGVIQKACSRGMMLERGWSCRFQRHPGQPQEVRISLHKTDGNTLGCATDDDVKVSQHFFAVRLSPDDVVKVLKALQNAKIGVSTAGSHHYAIFGDMNQQGTLSGKNCSSGQNCRGGLFKW